MSDQIAVNDVIKAVGADRLAHKLQVKKNSVYACQRKLVQKFPANWMPVVRALWEEAGNAWTDDMENDLFRWKEMPSSGGQADALQLGGAQ